MTVCRVKSKPYIKIGRSQIIQTVLVNSMGEKNNLKTKLNVVPINLSDVCQRPCYRSALRRV